MIRLITVTIFINGHPILTRSAMNKGRQSKSAPDEYTYDVDDGRTLIHKRSDGVVPLAIAMLKTIKEPKGGEG